MVVFEEKAFYKERKDVVTNPVLIVEVASSSVFKYERSKSFFYYKTLPSLQEYVRIEQQFPRIISGYKSAEHTWVISEVFELKESLSLESINGTIELKDIYRHMMF